MWASIWEFVWKWGFPVATLLNFLSDMIHRWTLKQRANRAAKSDDRVTKSDDGQANP